MPRVQMTGKQSEGWQPLPKGTFIFQIDAMDEGASKNTQNPQYKMSIHVVGGDHDGKKATDFLPLSDKAIWRWVDLIDATGIGEVIELQEIDPESGKPKITIDVDTDEFIGALFKADVTIDEYPAGSGKMQNRFNQIRPAQDQPAQAAAAPASAGAPSSNGSAAAAPTAPATAPAQAAAAAPTAGAQQRRRRSV